MTLGGGWGVVTSDLCDEYGLEVVPLAPELLSALDALLPPYWSRGNPVDLVGEDDPQLPVVALKALMEWDGCDAVLNLGIMGRRILAEGLLRATAAVDPTADAGRLKAVSGQIEAAERSYIEHVVQLMEEHQKPILGVSLATEASGRTLYEAEGAEYRGVFFPSPERAVRALAHMCDYRGFLSRGD
jgi:acyl-CoA synthetase (NDP forming)